MSRSFHPFPDLIGGLPCISQQVYLREIPVILPDVNNKEVCGMENIRLNIEQREEVGGGNPARLRKNGYIPGIVYGLGKEPVPAKIRTAALKAFILNYGKNSVFTTEFAEEHDLSVLIKDIQYHPVTKDIIHVDLQRVSMTEKIQTDVPVKVIGASKVEKEGGIVQYQLHEVTVESFPQDVPKYIEVDISAMTPGQSLTASCLKLPEGVTLVTDPGEVILSITDSKLELDVDKIDEPVAPVGGEGKSEAAEV